MTRSVAALAASLPGAWPGESGCDPGQHLGEEVESSCPCRHSARCAGPVGVGEPLGHHEGSAVVLSCEYEDEPHAVADVGVLRVLVHESVQTCCQGGQSAVRREDDRESGKGQPAGLRGIPRASAPACQGCATGPRCGPGPRCRDRYVAGQPARFRRGGARGRWLHGTAGRRLGTGTGRKSGRRRPVPRAGRGHRRCGADRCPGGGSRCRTRRGRPGRPSRGLSLSRTGSPLEAACGPAGDRRRRPGRAAGSADQKRSSRSGSARVRRACP